ncbi:hypothetical protein QUF70_10360 [Desulfobacterales bacterium HSG17]|nr:hypothetical protein [Desulfobacterales bacterium HSG17]
MKFGIMTATAFIITAILIYTSIPGHAEKKSDNADSAVSLNQLIISNDKPVSESVLSKNRGIKPALQASHTPVKITDGMVVLNRKQKNEVKDEQKPVISENTKILSQELSRALKLYHKEDYSRALKILKKISIRHKTPDILYWLGTSASRKGDCNLAVRTLHNLLKTRPDFQRARLELGIAYYNCKDQEKADAEFEQILLTSPPPEIKTIIARHQPHKNKTVKIFLWKMKVSQAYQYDSNISGGPSEKLISVGNVIILLDDKSKKQDGTNWISEIKGDFIWDVGNPGTLFLNGGVDFYYSHSLDDSDFNYLNAGVFTGPYLKLDRDVFKIPFGYSYKRYGNESLSGSIFVNPGIEFFFNRHFSVKSDYRFALEKYENPDYKDAGYDNSAHLFSIGPNLYFNNNKYIASALFTKEDHNADDSGHSYNAEHAAASFYSKFPTNTELVLSYKWSNKKYNSPSNLYEIIRKDRRHTITGIITQNFLKYYFVSGELAYIANNSNADLYDFDKTMVTLNAGVNY